MGILKTKNGENTADITGVGEALFLLDTTSPRTRTRPRPSTEITSPSPRWR